MKAGVFGVVVTAIMALLMGSPCFPQGALAPHCPQGSWVQGKCASRQPVPQPPTRSVSVRIPFSCPPVAVPASPCSRVRYHQPQTLPVRVEIGLRPESSCQTRRAPIMFRDPGPLRPVICHGVSLAGALVAAPFRLIETVFPVGPHRLCPAVPPVPMRFPVPNSACPPPAPSIAPFPQSVCPSVGSCLPPPMLVQEQQLPAWEPKSLIGGLCNLPLSLLTRGRWTGDWGQAVPLRQR